ncbi:MAG: hypothetical protein JOZ47_10095 [Kutzneria sp.]|nr:hypothetical protein [Kutzneria sp.]
MLAAGAFGTTRLLLGNRLRFPGISDALGSRFSGNGDLITFVTRAKRNGRPRRLDASRGPVITTSIRMPDELDGGRGRGFYLQEAGYPLVVDWLAESLDLPGQLLRVVEFAADRVRAALIPTCPDDLEHDIEGLLGDGALAVSFLPLLGMGRDTPDGVMRLRNGELDVSWTTSTSEAYFERVRATMRAVARELDGEYSDSPTWLRRRTVVAHPLGGAPVGAHRGEGVCDPYGEVFGHPGLYVADGAAMPGPVGANPSLTIAAMADRLCQAVLERRRPSRGGPPHKPTPTSRRRSGATTTAVAVAPARLNGGRTGATMLSFTEKMTGTIGFTTGEDSEDDRTELAVRLTITIDLDRFLGSTRHEARAQGWVDCAALGGRRRVTCGVVNLMVAGRGPQRRRMLYRLAFTDQRGRELVLLGHKDLNAGPPTAIWPDTTTLHVRLLHGPVRLGAGVLRLGAGDFLRQLGTVRTAGGDPLRTLERFGLFFLGSLWDVYRPRMSA